MLRRTATIRNFSAAFFVFAALALNTDLYLEAADPAFWLEHVADGRWAAVGAIAEGSRGLLISHPLPPGSTVPHVVHWGSPYGQPYYGELPYGDYRLVMGFPYDWYNNEGVRPRTYAALEFSLNELVTAEREAALARAAARFEGVTAEFVAFIEPRPVEFARIDVPSVLINVTNNNPQYTYNWSSRWLLHDKYGDGNFAHISVMIGFTHGIDGTLEPNANVTAPHESSELWLELIAIDGIQPGRHRLEVNINLQVTDCYITANAIHFRDMQKTLYVEFDV